MLLALIGLGVAWPARTLWAIDENFLYSERIDPGYCSRHRVFAVALPLLHPRRRATQVIHGALRTNNPRLSGFWKIRDGIRRDGRRNGSIKFLTVQRASAFQKMSAEHGKILASQDSS